MTARLSQFVASGARSAPNRKPNVMMVHTANKQVKIW